MTDINASLQQVKSNESFLERIKRFIPGYDGYVNRDNSRELDTILRNKLAIELDSNHVKLKNTVLNLAQRGKQTGTQRPVGFNGASRVFLGDYRTDGFLQAAVYPIWNTSKERHTKRAFDIRYGLNLVVKQLDKQCAAESQQLGFCPSGV